ncbi:NAD-dependent epimerase/dehydratase family protein [Enterococcus sp. AD013-P3]|uniref:NAD-dependent epimerase/dehydratase family protein n=1 Tax=Enterococcus sp. AD013-P3 TaxID=3411036 RepID=UPI003B9655FB
MDYLITGGAGFIGSTLINRLAEDLNNNIFVVDDLSMGELGNIDNMEERNINFIKASVTDSEVMEKLLVENNFDYIFHLAAVASVADSVARPLETHEVNFKSVLQLLELCRNYQTGLKRLVFASSAAVYGDEPTLPKQEESIIRPLTPYAVDKFAAERYVLNHYSLYGVPTSAVRFFNVYGPNQNPNSPYSGVLSILTDRFQKMIDQHESQFTVFGDGEQTRDFIFVEDVVDALLLVSKSESSLGNVYNVGTGTATSLNDVITLYKKIIEVDIPVVYTEAREGDIPRSFADNRRLVDLGFIPKYTIESGIQTYLESVLKK